MTKSDFFPQSKKDWLEVKKQAAGREATYKRGVMR